MSKFWLPRRDFFNFILIMFILADELNYLGCRCKPAAGNNKAALSDLSINSSMPVLTAGI